MANRVCFFEIPARDTEAASAFYSVVFDWHIEPADEAAEYLLIREASSLDGAPSGAIVPSARVGRGTTLYVAVDDLDAAVARASEAGGEVVYGRTMLEGIGWAALIEDPAGNAIGIVESDEAASPE